MPKLPDPFDPVETEQISRMVNEGGHEPKPEIDAETAAAIEKFESSTEDTLSPETAQQLRKDVEEHQDILRRSRELGNNKVYP